MLYTSILHDRRSRPTRSLYLETNTTSFYTLRSTPPTIPTATPTRTVNPYHLSCQRQNRSMVTRYSVFALAIGKGATPVLVEGENAMHHA